ncbi:hypothetical protein SteCoe_25599 [Stentor coeruleus]|uniref:START domain-containing protein n=1 Tax=Stentor coeruleus TaxID=5963 RepID=A0A1R2BEZ3_9CILI|nr:hypothetical protein SteCoe_25599 [Stentor coeruleus]
MGCCDSREKKNQVFAKSEQPEVQSPRKSWTTNTNSLKLLRFEDLTEPKAIEILEYIIELESQNKWQPALSEADLTISKLENSKYDKSNIVTKACFYLDKITDLKMILHYITHPASRKSWDFFINQMEVIEEDMHSIILYRKIKVLFYSAEFVEKQVVTILNGKIYVLTYSTEHVEKPQNKDNLRAVNVMSSFVMEELENGIKISVINQTDPKSNLGSLASSVGIYQQKAWIKKFRNQVLEHEQVSADNKN